MHSEKRKPVLNTNTSILCQYSDNTNTNTPILFDTGTINTNTTNKTILQCLNTCQCRYRQYQHQTIPSIPIPKSVGVGTCLNTTRHAQLNIDFFLRSYPRLITYFVVAVWPLSSISRSPTSSKTPTGE